MKKVHRLEVLCLEGFLIRSVSFFRSVRKKKIVYTVFRFWRAGRGAEPVGWAGGIDTLSLYY